MKQLEPEEFCTYIKKDVKRLANFSFKENESAIRNLYASRYREFRGGHRNIKTVDQGQLVSRIVEECSSSQVVAATILRIWYETQKDLKQEVTGALTDLGYNVCEPDFQNQILTFRSLRNEHRCKVDDLNFFDHAGRVSSEHSRPDVTIMAALLGWFPVDEEDTDDPGESDQDTNLASQTTERPEIASVGPSQDNFFKNLDTLQSEYDAFCAEKDKCAEELGRIQRELQEDVFSVRWDDMHSQVQKLRNTLETLWTKAEGLPAAAGITMEKSDRAYGLQSYLNRMWIAYLAPRVEQCRQVFDVLPRESVTRLTEKLKSIESTLKPESPPAVLAGTAKELMELQSEIESEQRKASLAYACSLFRESETAENAGLIFRALGTHPEPADWYVLACLFGESGMRLPAPQCPAVAAAISGLTRTKDLSFAASVIEDQKLQSFLAHSPEMQTLTSLLAARLHMYGEKDLALAGFYTNNNMESLRQYPALYALAGAMISGHKILPFSEPGVGLKEITRNLEETFRRVNGRFVHQDIRLQSGLDTQYRNFVLNRIYPRLHDLYENLKTGAEEKIRELREKLVPERFAESLYDEARREEKALVSNHNYEKKVRKFVRESTEDLVKFADACLHDLRAKSPGSVNQTALAQDIENLAHDMPVVQDAAKEVLDAVCGKKPAQAIHRNSRAVMEGIMRSAYLSVLAPGLASLLAGTDASRKDLLTVFLREADERRTPEQALDVLLDAGATLPADIVAEHCGLKKDRITEIRAVRRQEILQLHGALAKSGMAIPPDALMYENEERWHCAINLLKQKKEECEQAEKKSHEQLLTDLRTVGVQALRLKMRFMEEEYQFTHQTAAAIKAALDLAESIAQAKENHKLAVAQKIIQEVGHLWSFKGDPLDSLLSLIASGREQEHESVGKLEEAVNLPLDQFRTCVAENDFAHLGFTERLWEKVSSERREDIIAVLDSWLYLRDKVTTHDAVMKDIQERDEIEQNLRALVAAIAKICSLYRTNDQNRIGQDPLADWHGNLPFIFCTRLQSPRCEALNQKIRLYVISAPQLSGKSTIRSLADYISENKHASNSLSMFIVLGDRKKFDTLNTYAVTRGLPVLDESALKRIVLSLSRNRLPKWEFVSLLTLNSKISTIQPFKTQGSVTSELGIFVGRSDIIREMTTSRKDYAVYGGRRIGKSSLIAEVKAQLESRGYKTAYQSLQGIDSQVSIARAITMELQGKGLSSGNAALPESLEDFGLLMKNMYQQYPEQDVAVFLDEVDEMIIRDRNAEKGRHQIIEIFRDIAHETGHRWRFVFAGFKEMYLEIHGKGIYERRRNPWENFVDEYKQLSELESPRELISEGLHDILGLEYDKEVADLIENYSTGHPAFLQKFCQCLVNAIDHRVSPLERRIYRADVDRVFKTETEFINFVRETIDLNLSAMQKALVYVAAHERMERFTESAITEKLKDWCGMLTKPPRVNPNAVRLELELLLITGVIRHSPSGNEYHFANQHYIEALIQIERVDADAVQRALEAIGGPQ